MIPGKMAMETRGVITQRDLIDSAEDGFGLGMLTSGVESSQQIGFTHSLTTNAWTLT